MRALDIAHQWIVAILAICIVGPLTWWAMDNEPPVFWPSVEVLTPEVVAGGIMHLRVRVVRTRVCDGYRILTVVDSQGIVHDSERMWFDVRPSEKLVTYRDKDIPFQHLIVQVPNGAAPGPAKHYATYTWFCNPLQEAFPGLGIRAERPEVLFTIIPKPLPMAPPSQGGE